MCKILFSICLQSVIFISISIINSEAFEPARNMFSMESNVSINSKKHSKMKKNKSLSEYILDTFFVGTGLLCIIYLLYCIAIDFGLI